MGKPQEKAHKFDIGEGYGIWTDLDGETHRSFPEEFCRAKNGDSAGKYKIGDFVIMNQPTTKKRFGMFLIANVETGDFGGTGLKYKIMVKSCYGQPKELQGTGPWVGQQSDNGNRKETKMKQPTYKMMKIALADCRPHADAEAYSASSEDRAALSNSINESGLLSPIAVIPAEDGRGYYVIDGIGRLNALMAAGVTETEAQIFDLGDLSVAEFVVCKNAMMRKVTTGTRVMAYLKCHEREVLAAAEPEKYGSRKTSKWRNKVAAVSHETAADDKGWNAKEIAERIGVSKNDVLAGIELLKACADGDGAAGVRALPGDGRERTPGAPHYEQLDLFETAEAVLRGETPIRRWKAAAGGKVSKTGGKAAADYAGIGARTMVSLAGLWQNWQTVPMESRGPLLEKFRTALAYVPEDFRALLKNELFSEIALRTKSGKRI